MGVADILAFDRASARSYDRDGRLHVAISNISKGNVCPYRGSGIPGAEELGLDPDKIYYLYRDPAELERGAATFNNLPILSKHVSVSAEKPQKDLVIGSTGTDARFEDPYLRNSLVFWDADAIKAIEDGKKVQLSCAYHYTPVMEAGDAAGVHFDGRMTNIVGNHVASVPEGRAGDDVVVGDAAMPPVMDAEACRMVARDAARMMAGGDAHEGFAKLKGELARKKGINDPAAVAAAIGRKKYGASGMAKKAAAGRRGDHAMDQQLESEMNRQATTTPGLSRKALIARGALAAYLAPKLAQDQAMPDLRKVLLGTTATNWPKAKPVITERLKAAVIGKLAKDANVDDVHTLLDRLDKEGDGEKDEAMPEDRSVMRRRAGTRDAAPPDLENREQMDPEEREDNPGAGGSEAEDDGDLETIAEFLATKLAPEDMHEMKAMVDDAKMRRKAARDARMKARDAGMEDETPEEKAERLRKGEGDAARKRAEDARHAEDLRNAAEDAARRGRKAMDQAIDTAIKNERERAIEAREAERVCRPFVGDLIAQDSAEDYYRVTLESLGVSVKGVHPSAYKAILLAQPKPGSQRQARLAEDALPAANDEFNKRFPDFGRLKSVAV